MSTAECLRTVAGPRHYTMPAAELQTEPDSLVAEGDLLTGVDAHCDDL